MEYRSLSPPAMNIRLRLGLVPMISLSVLLSINVSAQSGEAESCPAPTPPAPIPAPTPTAAPAPAPSSTESASTTIVIDLPGSSSDWGGVLEHFKLFLRQLGQVRQLIGTKHFLSELLTALRIPGAKEHWIKLFEDISLEDILDNFAFGGIESHTTTS